MNKLQPDRTQPGKRPEDVRQKDRLTLTGQGAFQENIQESIQAIGMILRSGGAVADLTARQFRLVGRTVGNTQLIKLLDAEGVGRCLRIEEAAWSLDNLPAMAALKENRVEAGPPETGSTPVFEAVNVAQLSPSNPFVGGGNGGLSWTG